MLSVGTFIHGFDALVAATDAACGALGLAGFAQIGHSRVTPRHMAWERFLPEPALRERLAAARIVVCHGGMGILGLAMRARRPILAVPRRGPTTPDNPANDQREFLRHLAALHPIHVCAEPADLTTHLRQLTQALPAEVDYRLACDVPDLIARFLALNRDGSGRTRLPRRSPGGC